MEFRMVARLFYKERSASTRSGFEWEAEVRGAEKKQLQSRIIQFYDM